MFLITGWFCEMMNKFLLAVLLRHFIPVIALGKTENFIFCFDWDETYLHFLGSLSLGKDSKKKKGGLSPSRFPCCISFLFVTLIFVMKYKNQNMKIRVSWVGQSSTQGGEGVGESGEDVTSLIWPKKSHFVLFNFCFGASEQSFLLKSLLHCKVPNN